MYTHFFTRLSSLSQKNLLDSFTSFCSFSLFNFQGPASHLLGDRFLIISYTFPFVNNFFLLSTSFFKLLCVFRYPSQNSLFIIPHFHSLSTTFLFFFRFLPAFVATLSRAFLYYIPTYRLCQRYFFIYSTIHKKSGKTTLSYVYFR